MAHYPVNHRLRNFWRLLAGFAGGYLLLFGVAGLAATWGEPLLNRGPDWVLGLRTNPAAAWLDTLIGLALVAGVLGGGNLLHRGGMMSGWVLCGYAVAVITTLRTDANVFNASMANVITYAVTGLVVLTAGLYGRVGSAAAERAEAAAAHGQR